MFSNEFSKNLENLSLKIGKSQACFKQGSSSFLNYLLEKDIIFSFRDIYFFLQRIFQQKFQIFKFYLRRVRDFIAIISRKHVFFQFFKVFPEQFLEIFNKKLQKSNRYTVNIFINSLYMPMNLIFSILQLNRNITTKLISSLQLF